MIGTDAFLPIVLIALSVIFVFIWQLSNASKQRANVRAAQDQLDAAYRNTVPQIDQKMQQSKAVQQKLEALVTDVLKLANEGDPDAQAIKGKYKIEQNAPVSAPPSGGAAASPAPAGSP